MIGTKVLCIDDNFSNSIAELTAKGQKLNLPKKDSEYIIRAVFDNDVIGEPSYLLEGLYNPLYAIPLIKEFRELSFANWRFRTLQNQTVELYSEKEEKITI
jgi:hypothetical protein